MTQAMMGCIPAFSRGSKVDPHSVPETRGLACDGCPLLSCIKQKSRRTRYRYWCDHAHAKIDPSIGCERKPKPSTARPFFEHLREAMERAGMDKRALADAVGASPNTVRGRVSGKVAPRRDFLATVFDVLDMDEEAKDAGWRALGQKRV